MLVRVNQNVFLFRVGAQPCKLRDTPVVLHALVNYILKKDTGN